MKRTTMAVMTAASLMVVGQGHSALGQMPNCDPARSGAAPGQQYGTAADVAAKKQADAEKYRTAAANSATQACNAMPAPAKDATPNQKQ